MARTHTLYLAHADVPARAPLQQAIKDLKVSVVLDADYAPFETAGYLPVTVEGEDAGCDMRFQTDCAHALAPGKDVGLTIKWGGDIREFIAASVISAALARSFGGVIVGEGDALVSADDLLKKARTAIEESF